MASVAQLTPPARAISRPVGPQWGIVPWRSAANLAGKVMAGGLKGPLGSPNFEIMASVIFESRNILAVLHTCDVIFVQTIGYSHLEIHNLLRQRTAMRVRANKVI